MPVFASGSLIDDNFYNSLESYLNFRNPFRAEYIKSTSWLDVIIFKTSSTANVHRGLNNWMYYRPAIKSFLKADCPKKVKAFELAKSIHRLEERLKKTGKRFVFVVAPDKATIYPEYMGGVREANDCGKNFYDLFLEALKKYPVKGFVRLDQRFLEEKKTNLLYYTGGTHWNDRGAALAAKLILEKLSTPNVSYRLPHIDFREKKILSESAPMLSVDLYELTPVAHTIRFQADVKTDNIEALPFFPGEWTKIRTTSHCPSCRPLLPKAIIYRDSFMTSTLKFIKGSFEEIYARWSSVFPEATRSGVRELATSDIVIIEIAERDMDKLKIMSQSATEKVLGKRAEQKKLQHALSPQATAP
ncbi:MAG: hypothetical protein ACE5DR_07150 [Thermodesulfobacteriota bacterium]